MTSLQKIRQAPPGCFALTVSFALTACPNGVILPLLHQMGLHIDASSEGE